MKREDFLNLLSRKISNELSDSERERLDKALLDNPEYVALEKVLAEHSHSIAIHEANLTANLEKVWEDIREQEDNSAQSPDLANGNPFKIIWRIAAAILVIVTAGSLFTYISHYHSTPMVEISSGDEKLFITLDDGSSVWLNKNTILQYNQDFGTDKREIVLKGEAFFDVIKNQKVPMVIEAGNLLIKVKGTAFNVEAYNSSQKVVVALVRGLVEVFDRDNQKNRVELKPSQQLSYSNGSEGSYFSIAGLSAELNRELSLWRTDSLVFRKEKLQNLATQLEKKYEVKIEIRNEKLKEKRFSGSFTDENINQAIEALKLSFPFKYQIREKHVIIE